MGLAIGVGIGGELERAEPAALARFREDLEHVNALLRIHGLAEHVESEPPAHLCQEFRASIRRFPYSWLHYLRRFAAHIMRDPHWVPSPVEPGEDPADDPVLTQMYRTMRSHLLCHSDCEGYYVPADFAPVLFDTTQTLRGGALGSSYRLREELRGVADALEIELSPDGELSDETARRLSEQRPTGQPFAIERLVWLALYEAARLSIAHRMVIAFY